MVPEIRILNEADAGALFKLRRAALLDSPFAFLASPEDDVMSSEDAVRDLLLRAPGSAVFGAVTEQLVGMLGLNRVNKAKAAHQVGFWGMFVLPQWRRRGLGERLLHAAIDHARTLEGVTSIQLGVSESATAARRLYESAGFRVWGTEPNAIRVQGRCESERHMALSLQPVYQER